MVVVRLARHGRGRTLACAAVLAVVGIGGGGCSRLLHRESDVRVFQSVEVRPDRFRIVAVVPADLSQFGPQIAHRAYQMLKDRGRDVVWIASAYEEGPGAMERLCPRGRVAPYDGVVFVTWDRVTLRDCETHEVAFDVQGGYTGVDAMTARLLRYLNGGGPGEGR